jgi:integrase
MQKGSLIQSSRRRGPDVWEYRWRESCPGDKRKHCRIVIGSLDTLRDKAAALKATAALGRWKYNDLQEAGGHLSPC